MSNKKEILIKYGQAVEYLPPRFRAAAMENDKKAEAEEFRLRAGQYFSIVTGGAEIIKKEAGRVRHEELETVLELATRSSVHTSQAQIKEGYVTVTGGHRVGICGSVIKKGEEICGIRDISSVSIRIAKEIKNAADGLEREIMSSGRFGNTLIISPPGHGKTTMLRDLVRRISDSGIRVSLVDERGEVAAKRGGVAQFDVGRCTDVLDGVRKAVGAMLMLRAMSPRIIALDEITAEEDIEAISAVINCGVGILATAHGDDAKSLFLRPLYRKLLDINAFENIVVLKKSCGQFSYTLNRSEEGMLW